MSDVQKKKVVDKRYRRERAHQRLRQRVAGSNERPRLSVYKSDRYVCAQVIDDVRGHTIVSAASLEPERGSLAVHRDGRCTEQGQGRRGTLVQRGLPYRSLRRAGRGFPVRHHPTYFKGPIP